MTVIILMGVAGAGKTTVGKRLAECLGWELVDADDLQTPVAVRKLASGRRLTTQERINWLKRVRGSVHAMQQAGLSGIVAFPGLRTADRAFVFGDDPRLRVVFLRCSAELLDRRVRLRKHRFFNPRLLPSEFSILEEPSDSLVIDGALSVEQIVTRIRTSLKV